MYHRRLPSSALPKSHSLQLDDVSTSTLWGISREATTKPGCAHTDSAFAGVHFKGLAEDDRLLEEFKRFEGWVRQQAHSHEDSDEEVSVLTKINTAVPYFPPWKSINPY